MINDYSIIKSLLIEDDYILSKNILKQIVDETNADCLALYYISLASGKFNLFNLYGDDKFINKSSE